ncbi:MAG: gliding motility-associated C-terminal domain-containing protein [Saprospiraceae bacterium]
MKKNLLFLLYFIQSFYVLFAQPANDNCSNAVKIVDVTQYCSKVGEFTNVGGTPSYGAATCWVASPSDVWFSFRALASDVSITIIGTNPKNNGVAGGTLSSMVAALYSGVCGGTINQLACSSDNANNGILTLYKGGLIVGQQYFIRIDGRNNAFGTFQLCINNYFPPAKAEQDCRAATVLCNNNPFVNDAFSGNGIDPNEAAGSCLGEGGGLGSSESQSTWYTWIAKNDCQLTFTLRPLNPSDDLDFAVYELPSGIHNCADKKLLRCNATAPPCAYATGLNLTDRDTSENFNCDAGENGFSKYIDMVAGRAYTLVINNFSNTGIGFAMDWGGCEFQGPEPLFKVIPDSGLRCETLFSVEDFSTFVAGNITKYEWNFGVGAIPQTADTKGPHGVSYNSFGEKFITLTLTTDLGCKISKVKRIVAEPCCEDLPDIEVIIDSIYDVKCFGEKNGRIVFRGNKGNPYTDQLTQLQYYTFSLDGIDFFQITDLNNLAAGTYTLYIQDRKGCTSSINFTIAEPPPVLVSAGSDLEILLGDKVNLSATVQPSGVYNFIWSTFGTEICSTCQTTTYSPLKDGYYTVTAIDENGCIGKDSIFIRVKKEYNVFAPNVLSSNDDGINDYFIVRGNDALVSLEKLEIFDRWGGKTYGRQNVSKSEFDRLWDGTFQGEKVNPGVFTYVIIAKFIDGTIKDFSGDITILR